MLLPAILGCSAAMVLLLAGYVFGAKRGYRVRKELRDVVVDLALDPRHRQDGTDTQAWSELGKVTEVLMRQGDALQRMVESLVQRDGEVEYLRTLVQQGLTPLLQREQLAFELSNMPTGSGHRGELTHLLDQIAEKGHFGAVLLSDEDGLPLGASSNAKELDRLAAIASLVLLLADRMSRNGGAIPLSLMVHDETNRETLWRILHIGDRRFLLTAVSSGALLTPTALDAALPTVDSVLSAEYTL